MSDKMKCSKCQRTATLNATGVCKECRVRKYICGSCRKEFMGEKHKAYCPRCRDRTPRKRPTEDDNYYL